MNLIQIGPRDAKVVIVGEAPGAKEAATGIPFVGASGELLDRIFGRVGMQREEYFITNVCHTQPPGNRFDYFLKPKPRLEYIQGVIQLKKDLEEIKPNLVIGLGAQSLRVLTGKDGISKYRGSILPCRLTSHDQKVICTYHPAAVFRVWEYKAIIEFDMKRCADELHFPDIEIPVRDYYLDPDRFTTTRIAHEMEKAEWLAVDIECWEDPAAPSGWVLACVGFSDHAGRALTIPSKEDWQMDLIRLLCRCGAKKILQNGNFDWAVLADGGIELANFAWDTMLAHHALYPECAGGDDEMSKMAGKKKTRSVIQKGLSFLTSINTKEPYYKDDGKVWKETGDIEMFWRYNARDAAVTREIQVVQEKDLAEFGTMCVLEHEMALVPWVHKQTRRGIRIDMDLRASLKTKFESEIENLQMFLDGQAGSSINVKSSKQIQELLYDQLKLPVQRNRMTKRPTVDKDAITALGLKSKNPVLHTIIDIRQRRDFVERYINAKVDADNRMRCAFDITGTRSGRLSSRQSIYGSGTNLQTIPARRPEGEAIRRMFIPDDGKVFVYRDYAQAEAWIVAYLSRSEILIELLNDSERDLHCENAKNMFGHKIAKLVEDGGDVTEDERYLAKRVVHASNYEIKEDQLVRTVNEDGRYTGVYIDHQKARFLLNAYFMVYPEIKENFWREIIEELKYSRTLTTPFGRKRVFYARWDNKLFREAYSYIPQSTVGDLCCKALVKCFRDIEGTVPGAEVLLNVHDSILMQCNKEDVEKVSSMMELAMRIPITLNDQTFIIPTDCEVGYNWGKKKPDNERGLAKWAA